MEKSEVLKIIADSAKAVHNLTAWTADGASWRFSSDWKTLQEDLPPGKDRSRAELEELCAIIVETGPVSTMIPEVARLQIANPKELVAERLKAAVAAFTEKFIPVDGYW